MCQYDKVSDEELITRLREGESGISDYLMEKYKGMVRQKARAMFLIGGDTDDLIQEGMIGLLRRFRILSRRGKPPSRPLRACVWTGRFIMPSRPPAGRSTSR